MNDRVIYKQVITPFNMDSVEVVMPRGARPMSCAEQHGNISVWFLVDISNPPELVGTLRVVMTGTPFDFRDNEQYVGTTLLAEGRFVAHVFWYPKEKETNPSDG